MIDDGGMRGARSSRRDVSRVDTHIPTVRAAGNRTRTRQRRRTRRERDAATAAAAAKRQARTAPAEPTGTWPGRALAGGLLLGVGLGGLLDGIVLHQLLQWHHLVSDAGHPVDTVRGLERNTLADGIFHAGAWLVTLLGAWLLLAAQPLTRAPRLLAGTLLAGWGLFNLVEGLVNHLLLGIHHVNETVPSEQYVFWDLGLLALSGALLAGGAALLRIGAAAMRAGAR